VLSTIKPAWRNSPSQAQRVSYRWGDANLEIAYDDGIVVVAESPTLVTLDVDGDHPEFEIDRFGSTRFVDGPSGPLVFEELPRFSIAVVEEAPGSLHAPMPGRVARVEVAVGDTVEEGRTLLVLEAMKMEHTLRSPVAGTVVTVNATPGEQAAAGDVLVVVEPG
jgi:biotin carboxyl carrier protein